MVGTPRSRGCENCRKRKKKCGEERPECRACVATGLTCPGFSKRWKFVDENPQLSTYYQNKRYIFEEIDMSMSQGSVWHQDSYQFSLEYYSRADQTTPSRQFEQVIFPSLAFAHDSLISSLIYIINDPKSQSLCQTQCFVTFISYLPARLGRNMALDAIVATFCGIHADMLSQNSDTKVRALRAYSKGLKALRTCIEEPKLRHESETICASIILQVCEVLINKDRDNWTHLTRGSKYLISGSEPTKYLAPFEHAMLHSQQTVIMLQDIGNAESCFLSQPEWLNKLRTIPNIENTERLPYLSVRAEFCDILVYIHELLSELSELPILDDAQPNTRTRHESAVIRARRIDDNIKNWYSRAVEPLILPGSSSSSSKLDDPEEDTAFIENYAPHYPDALIAMFDCISNFVILKLEKMILSLSSALSLMANEQLNFSISPSDTAKRRASMRASYKFIAIHSEHSVKPLSSALQQISLIDNTISKFSNHGKHHGDKVG